ncbi:MULTISPECIES: hypothetical protein [unclassified Pseudomonas]|uniref:hypothetical protein n=1 Tax=unclassified Pseudomonas TaxID=196821 RepID=UPI000C881992|nr:MULTISPECIES: hypothetical protein [unclassified Pseudomonas]PMX27595.1 hypothetical protein C1Y24_34220 [Pseudomonas sp. MPR-R2A4]PMX28751.1 hypothetical protein C1Y23_03310 [Pseudomonas sp. GW460-12]PMX38433.1 hypothetical protein C1Y26_22630 [Pseudomonas sp. MPR-R2A7]PMX51345.1 hypothetical protein C1Y17_24430 [Pseudomonas sp. MPR-R2A6]PMX86198.1 hypothetical protein C1Y21_24890 [Pseudomonas sp. MPR-R2A3]
MIWYGKIDTAESFPVPDDQPWPYPEGWVQMNSDRPDMAPDYVSPTRFGAWFARSTGAWEWVVYPDPPFNVVYHEGKLKNGDTLVEIDIATLPGNIAARLTALEAALLPPTP